MLQKDCLLQIFQLVVFKDGRAVHDGVDWAAKLGSSIRNQRARHIYIRQVALHHRSTAPSLLYEGPQLLCGLDTVSAVDGYWNTLSRKS
jgi:hypothetical protein